MNIGAIVSTYHYRYRIRYVPVPYRYVPFIFSAEKEDARAEATCMYVRR